MRFVMTIKAALGALMMLALVACGGGGGGDSGTLVLPGTGSGGGSGTGSTGSPSVTLSLSSPTVTVVAPATITVTVRDAKGNPMSGTVVDLTTVRGTLASLSVASVATDANGNATATLSALTGGLSGADQVHGVAKLGTSTVQGDVSFTVAGSQPTLALKISSSTLRGSTGAVTLSATISDAAGKAVPNTLVSFTSAAGRIKLGAPSARTDSLGVASITAGVIDTTVTAADTLTASALVDTVVVTSSLVVQVVADVPDMLLSLSGSNVTTAVPVTLSILVLDATGKAVGAGTVVSLKSTFGLTAFDSSTVATNANGVAQVRVSPLSASSNGADQITASATVGGTPVSKQAVLQVSTTATIAVSVTVSPSLITTTNPGTVNVQVRDGKGGPVSGAVVDLSMVRGSLATLSVTSVSTDINGNATALLTAASAGRGGADQVVGVVKSDAGSAQGTASFTVSGTVATLVLTSSSTTLRVSSGAATLSASVKDAAGNSLPNVLVNFAAVNGRVKLGATSAVTNAAGVASVLAFAADASVTAAETVTANATVGAIPIQGAVVVQVLADLPPLITITRSNADATPVTTATPVTLSILVKDGTGSSVVAGAVVTVSSSFGLSAFDATTLVTNSSGVAQVTVSPKTTTSNGADQIVASATVGGVTAVAQTVLQIQTLTLTSTTVAVAISSPTITSASPADVTVTVRDAKGNPMNGAVVDLSTVRGTLATLSVSSVVTGANGVDGTAVARLSVASGGLSGADQVVAVVRGGAATAQGSAGFNVTGSAPTVNLTIAPTSTLRGSLPPRTLTATVRDAGGNLVPNLLVSFASVGGKVKLGAPSAVTDLSGVASVSATVTDASITAGDTLTASASVGSTLVQSALVVQLFADTPSITITGSSAVAASAPATLAILVKDTNGVAVAAGTIVNVSSAFGLSTFDAATLSTDSTGTARVVVTPKSANSNGADQIVASTTIGGVTVNAIFVVQVSSSNLTAPPLLQTALSSTSISSASPATVTATLTDGRGAAVAGEVVTFTVVRGLAKTNVTTALTDASGRAVVVLSPTSSTTAGADEVSAAASYAGTTLQSTKGFQIQATNVTLTSFTSAVAALGAYGQTTLTVGISGAAVGSPVNISVTSSCVSQGKATLSPATFIATTATVALQYKDNGCGALQTEDKLQASIVGGSGSVSLTLPVATPTASSLAFISASPEVIYIKGSGFTETSTLTFEVRDGAGNTLPNRSVTLSLLTRSGGVTMEGGIADVTQVSDAAGRVTVRVSSGTIPSPVRVSATLTGVVPVIATVSSNLSVAVGLPSQLNFSLSQRVKNIEGFNVDGTPNTYTIIASDRNGNPVPNGTSINFVTEGGQIQPIAQTQGAPSAAAAVALFQSSNPRPADGRITVTAYTLGEESFIDQNGNNSYDIGEPFQDLGNVFKDRIFDGSFDVSLDEFVPTNIANASACRAANDALNTGATVATTALLALDASIPSAPSSCDSAWSGAGKVYVRRATETVLSTSTARLLWAGKSGLDGSCSAITLQTGPLPTTTNPFTPVQGGETWYGSGGPSLSLPFIVADANTFPVIGPNGSIGRLNPVAALSTVTASSPTTGLKVTMGGGAIVPSTTEATTAAVGVSFDAASAGVVFVTVTSPGGVGTSYAINVQQTSTSKTSSCP